MNMMNIIDNSSYYYGMLNDVKKLLQSAKENNKKNGWDIMDYDINEDAGEIVEEWSAKWDYTEVKNIVNAYGVLEIIEKIEDEYGDEFVKDVIISRDTPHKYRVLLDYILMPIVKDIVKDELEKYYTELRKKDEE